MIRDREYNESIDKNKEIKQIALFTVKNKLIELNVKDLGLFEISGITEGYQSYFDAIVYVNECKYAFIEILNNKIGEIEYLYKHQDVRMIKLIFKDDSNKSISLPAKGTYRITELGDLRIELGDVKLSESEFIKKYRNFEITPNNLINMNYFIDEFGFLEYINDTPERDVESKFVTGDHKEIIVNQEDKLKCILGEITHAFKGKRLSKPKLAVLASIVDLKLQKEGYERINIDNYTYRIINIKNERVEQFKFAEYRNKRVSNSEIKKLIQDTCKEYKKFTIEKLNIERSKLFIDLLDFSDLY